MANLFTSDLHFFHDNVVKYSKRPWTAEEQTEILIKMWNKQVKKNDNVYHLGDFVFMRSVKNVDKLIELLKRLNGKKYFIKGNHCDDKVWKRIAEESGLVEWVKDYAKVIINGKKVIMCHYAFKVWDSSHYGSFNLFGHSHGNLEETTGKQLDVGIDNSVKVLGEYRLFTWDDIVKYMEKR